MAFNWVKFPWTNLHDLNLDWIIQTVKTLEGNLADAVSTFQEMINKAILNTLTGEGEFNVIKTGNVLINGKKVEIRAGEAAEGGNSIKLSENGDVRISGNSAQLSKTAISSGSEQLTMHNPTSNTSMTANYNSGVLTLTNNQESAKGVAIYPINTPADGGGDNTDFAANVGYVRNAVEIAEDNLDIEIDKRISGDAALQATIDNVIMPLITALQQKAIFNINAPVTDAFVNGNVTLNTTVISQLKTAISNNRFVSLTLSDNGALNDTLYLIINNHIKQISNPSEFKIYFKDIKGEHIADIDTATGVLTYSEF